MSKSANHLEMAMLVLLARPGGRDKGKASGRALAFKLEDEKVGDLGRAAATVTA